MTDARELVATQLGLAKLRARNPWLISMLAFFRYLSLAEGLSFLVILGVTVGWVSREYVYALGMTHGVLYIAYVIASLAVCGRQGWGLKIWLPLFLAAIIPFAFIGVDVYLRRAMRSAAVPQERLA